jgi:hypothetical protein
VLRPFRRIKRRRNDGDYAGSEDQIHEEDIHADLPAATAIVDAWDLRMLRIAVSSSR